MKKSLYIILIFILAACTTETLNESQLELALEFAEDNRRELESVLLHYRNDSEKLKAAKFLISNMPHWYSYEGWQLDSIKPVLSYIAHTANVHEMTERQKNRWKDFTFHSLHKVYDSKKITAQYLINNIDKAFISWKKRPWNKKLSFDDFCELLLPYRIGDESLTDWRSLYESYYAHLLDSLYHGSDVVEACNIINEELQKQGCKFYSELSLPHMDAIFLYNNRIGYCRENCDLGLYAMRSCGIPVAAEHFKYAPDYRGSHQWLTLRDTTGLFLQFGYDGLTPKRDTLQTDGRKKGKIYRFCYGLQNEQRDKFSDVDRIPNDLQNFYLKDVTANYFGPDSVKVPIQKRYSSIYLGVFTPEGWKAVDIGSGKKDSAVFRNIEPNIIYQPLIFTDNKRCEPAGYPFIYYSAGKGYSMLKKEKRKWEKITLERKMPLVPRVRKWLYENIIGSRIEASNFKDFRQARLLYEFKDTLSYCKYRIMLRGNHKFKYLRYKILEKKTIELADIDIYSDSLCSKKVSLKLISPIDPIYKPEHIIDNDMLSAFRWKSGYDSIVYELPHNSCIKCIDFYPRNDGNFIWPGDVYELFYQDGVNGWKTLGRQKATGKNISFYAPQNVLLWLRNLTHGKEEQVFIYQDGKQIFVQDIR